ncbi:seven-hairpin glycosidase [Punctularia strigosozonata HHB-11173 SS5]|uniref:seven-hairpin glycosidase n=1 Tax=Punctularia strigosozonata (strain HHB-11173) TaxID=741275 RepID=UPI00044180B4|nr:seven-hairpin glycosidase [Punctularia strigosozonata HHB-11173 SS5]EIN09625.1 seven-hairpin glycosidase [Punctularia strigosozonata HHB-11173 SS5]
MGGYQYMRLQARLDTLSGRLTARHVLFALFALCGTWSLYLFLFSRPYSFPPPIPGIGQPGFRPRPDAPWEESLEPTSWAGKAQRVKQAYMHAYEGYLTYAHGKDELLPLSNKSKNNFNGWGVSLFDSLDTMLLMGLNDEFTEALDVVQNCTFEMHPREHAPFFETVIRYLGGLLSAYALSGDRLLLDKAEDLGRKLAPAFGTASGFPVYAVNPTTGDARGSIIGSLAEIGSCQIEYMYLAKATGKKEFYDLADGVIKGLAKADSEVSHLGGMLPVRFNLTSGKPWDDELTVGAAADSAHEYLLKQYLLTSRTDRKSLEMYLRATTHILTQLLYLTPTRKLLYVTDSRGPQFLLSHRFEHLSCFFPGLLALGAHLLPLDDLPSLGISWPALSADLSPAAQENWALLGKYRLSDVHRWAAEGLAQACYLSYADQRSGLGPDEMTMHAESVPVTPEPGTNKGAGGTVRRNVRWVDALEKWRVRGRRGSPPGVQEERPIVYSDDEKSAGSNRPKGRDRDYAARKMEYLLRPETVESLYLMWRTTGDVRWRNRGWDIFAAIEREAWTPSGYASIRNVDFSPAPQKDDMPSFYLAETLKYLYLLFTDDDLVPLDKWVFNTEAHPLPVFEWTADEKARFGIP